MPTDAEIERLEALSIEAGRLAVALDERDAEIERVRADRDELLVALEDLKEAVDIVASEQCEAGEYVEWWNRYTGDGFQAAVKADAILKRLAGQKAS